jgi:DNA-binding FadR family transcriptional regulator
LIAEAIVERDPGAAAARMREHLERAAALALAGRAARALEESRNREPQPAPRARRPNGSR